jgi:hypothetical protein
MLAHILPNKEGEMSKDLAKLARLQPGDVILCGNCDAAIGTLHDVNGRLWLCVGGVTLEYGRGRCSKCLRLWNFDTGDIQLARLVQRKGGAEEN